MIEVDVVVVGGGAAGIAAACEAGRRGLAVALAEPAAVGGRAAHQTLLPWRSLARAADEAERGEDRDAAFAQARRFAEDRAVRWSQRQALRLEDAGAARLSGRARFTGPRELVVSDEVVRFDHAVLAVGARGRALSGDAPDGARLLWPSQLLALAKRPAEILVVGGGAAGAELVDSLSRLGGAELTWLMDDYGLLPQLDRELADAVGDVIMERGVKLVHGKRAEALELHDAGATVALDGGHRYGAAVVVIAAGNAPCFEGLGLDALAGEPEGLARTPAGFLEVDGRGATSVGHVFAAGDCTGRAANVAAAEAMGRCAVQAIDGSALASFDPSRVPHCVFTSPAAAQIGLTPDRARGREVVFHTLRAEEELAGLLDGVGESADAKGFLRLVCDSETGELLGATALGSGAPELINAAAIAMELRATDEQLARVIGVGPSALAAIGRAAR